MPFATGGTSKRDCDGLHVADTDLSIAISLANTYVLTHMHP
jgi:hypothetical protein